MSDTIILNIKKIVNDFTDSANSYLLLIFRVPILLIVSCFNNKQNFIKTASSPSKVVQTKAKIRKIKIKYKELKCGAPQLISTAFASWQRYCTAVW